VEQLVDDDRFGQRGILAVDGGEARRADALPNITASETRQAPALDPPMTRLLSSGAAWPSDRLASLKLGR
jgi:hypothetical protein